jgi:hypothetical protein
MPSSFTKQWTHSMSLSYSLVCFPWTLFTDKQINKRMDGLKRYVLNSLQFERQQFICVHQQYSRIQNVLIDSFFRRCCPVSASDRMQSNIIEYRRTTQQFSFSTLEDSVHLMFCFYLRTNFKAVLVYVCHLFHNNNSNMGNQFKKHNDFNQITINNVRYQLHLSTFKLWCLNTNDPKKVCVPERREI